MLARPELLLPLVFVVSSSLIVVALLLLRHAASKRRELPVRASAQTRQQTLILGSSGSMVVRTESAPRYTRIGTVHMFSGATAAALDELTRPRAARQRQQRVYL
jgi:hypothetical protein